MEVPLLSQDEFFRHLNLQSVHATAAKFHYRHALKERLRASSMALRKERAEKLASEKAAAAAALELSSPCRLLSPLSSNKLFGRPLVRKEVRALTFDDFPVVGQNGIKLPGPPEFLLNGFSRSSLKRPSILTPLYADSRVFRHPGIKRELEERTKLNGFCHPANGRCPCEPYPATKRARIEERRCYYSKPEVPKPAKDPKKKRYRASVRLQSTGSSEAVEWERKMAAALTLFGHPRKSDVLSTVPYLLIHGSHRAPLSVTSSSGKRSPSLPPPPSVTSSHRPSLASAGSHHHHNNNNVIEKDVRVCLTRLSNGSVTKMNSSPNLTPSVQLEKLPLSASSGSSTAPAKPPPRGPRPLLHRKAKEEPLAKPATPPPPAPPPAEKRKMTEAVKAAENSFECPICQKCFASGKGLLQHGEQTHLKCQSCGLSGGNQLVKFKPC
jgi:hypothetical protein